jgi:hypothetical protein
VAPHRIPSGTGGNGVLAAGLALILLASSCGSSVPPAPPNADIRHVPFPGRGKINGILIDSSRLIERREYYVRLVDFMADWGMNTLVWHFSDDPGCSIVIPGFEKLAAPRAFSVDETRRWIAYASARGIDIIPELEAFGHTRYITDHAEYASLSTASPDAGLSFHGLNPADPGSLELMGGLIRSVAALFPSPFIHLGCDEVDISAFCRRTGIDEGKASTDYLNGLIRIAHSAGKYPILWGDYVMDHRRIARGLDQNVVLIHWDYVPDVDPEATRSMVKAGFEHILICPAISSWHLRVLPSAFGLENTRNMAALSDSKGHEGVVTTIWLPVRYLQNAMYYGIAFSAEAVARGGAIEMDAFHEAFARRVFGLDLTPPLKRFLENWSRLEFDVVQLPVFRRIQEGSFRLSWSQRRALRGKNVWAADLLAAAEAVHPVKNADIWEGMRLAVKTAWAVSEAFLVRNGDVDDPRRSAALPGELDRLALDMDREWDRTREPDDPAKTTVKYESWPDQYILIMMKKLARAFRP